ncbi:E3 ubiquitin-protein ligase Midline-1-like [Haliotis cracherodii]|uniref:E3 ubiquitin-protein ligase Midline-1-like n=1 Tax=Haliotis cracherodii TaxID=6455 RepID=UPI0039ED8ED3
MAKNLIVSHLTCAVCTEVFTDPATLQCNHTFCKSCLLLCLKTRPEAKQARSIPCPSCRQLTKVTNPDSPVEEWVSQLKPSHVIQGLKDDFGYGSVEMGTCSADTPVEECVSQLKPSHATHRLADDFTQKYKDQNICSVCRDKGEITPASLWCSSCEAAFCGRCIRVHRRMPMSQNHDVKDIATREKSRSFVCECHDEKVTMFCRDCEKTICHICCNVDHRKCKSIAVISDVLPKVKASLMATKLDLEKEIALKMDIIEKRKLQTKVVSNRTDEVEAEIIMKSQTAMEKIRVEKKKLLDEMNRIKSKEIKQIQEELHSDKIAVKIRKERVYCIDNVLTSDSKTKVFDLYQATKSDTQTLTDSKHEEDITRVADSNFEAHMDRFTDALSKITLRNSISNYEEIIDYDTFHPTLHQRFNVNSSLDSTIPVIKDIVVISVRGIDIVVVTDWTNKSIKEFYTEHDQPLRKLLKLEESPFGITNFGDNLVLVSLPWQRSLYVVSVYPRLSMAKSIPTTRRYWGVSCMDEARIAAGVCDGVSSSVDILNQEGVLLMSVSNRYIQYPEYLHITHSGRILVSDNVSKSLLCLSCDGELLFKYTLHGDTVVSVPRGVTSKHKGDILLVDREVHKVILLTEAGEYVRDVLTPDDGLDVPQGVFKDKYGRLYVTCKEHIQVFK